MNYEIFEDHDIIPPPPSIVLFENLLFLEKN